MLWSILNPDICWFTGIPKCVEDHGEENKLPKEGDAEGGGGDDLGQEEEEHRQGEQDRDG